jgi:hypothetical protein
MRTLLLSSALAALLSSAACIERPPSPRDSRLRFDRSRLGEVVLREAPSSQKRVGAIFGDSVELVGAESSPSRPRPGDSVTVDFYFRVVDESEEDYKVFVHIDDRGGQAERINADHWPAGGLYPVKTWRKGEVVRDRWTFKVPSYYSGDTLEVWTGFYQPGKDDRWPLINRNDVRNDGQNRVMALAISMR